MKRSLLLATLLLAVFAAGRAQCPDFTDLTGPGVTCQYGDFYNPFMHTGVVGGRHTVITWQDTDPYTGNLLPLLPPGENAVVKLGNHFITDIRSAGARSTMSAPVRISRDSTP